jgi:hypothetical protein
VGGPDDPVAIPRGSTRTDWEVELGVVIGRRASYLDSPAESLGTWPASSWPTTSPSATSS